MIAVFNLKVELARSPDEVAAVQARTLDNRSLPGGLKGTKGLYGSEEWWQNIANGVIPIITIKGKIKEVFDSGMDNVDKDFVMKMSNGTTYTYSCVANETRNLKLYRVGAEIEIDYVVEELKTPIKTVEGVKTQIDEVLEIRLSAP